ncbi:MAG: alcohol dehydrogenase catalytic domain-containing protein [Actinomycetales bacterium]|nr:alcohol dehydrogenase catalytic domain-containing protein [Actinomycetales bacterium]
MTAVMAAAVYHGRGDIRVEERPVPEVRPGELLVRVATAGVCGTDSGEWDHGPVQHPVHARHPASGHLGPVIPGHEFSGTVEAVGPGVDADWLGREVASCGAVACGTCPPCARGESNRCTTYVGVGLHRDGALAGYVLTPPESCVPLDGLGISLDEAALCQPMAIAVHCASRAGDIEGQTVVVLGVGGIGTFLTYALAESGATVVAVDLDAARLELARELGAHRSVQTSGDDGDAALIRDAIGEDELRVVFEVSGTRGGLATALAVSPPGTRIVAVGIQGRPVEVDLAALTVRELSLIGTNAQVRETDFPRAVELVARRAGRWAAVAPWVLPLEDLVEGALRPMSEGRPPAVKTLIDPWSRTRRPLRGGTS